MEVDYNGRSISELITKLRADLKNSILSSEEIKSLLNYFLSLESNDKLNTSSGISLILLLCMSEEYEQANLRRVVYKVNIINFRIKNFTILMKNFPRFFRLAKG
jgi:hypothetical protein